MLLSCYYCKIVDRLIFGSVVPKTIDCTFYIVKNVYRLPPSKNYWNRHFATRNDKSSTNKQQQQQQNPNNKTNKQQREVRNSHLIVTRVTWTNGSLADVLWLTSVTSFHLLSPPVCKRGSKSKAQKSHTHGLAAAQLVCLPPSSSSSFCWQTFNTSSHFYTSISSVLTRHADFPRAHTIRETLIELLFGSESTHCRRRSG